MLLQRRQHPICNSQHLGKKNSGKHQEQKLACQTGNGHIQQKLESSYLGGKCIYKQNLSEIKG